MCQHAVSIALLTDKDIDCSRCTCMMRIMSVLTMQYVWLMMRIVSVLTMQYVCLMKRLLFFCSRAQDDILIF